MNDQLAVVPDPGEDPPPGASAQLVRATNEWLHPLEPYGPAKALKEMTRRIMLFDTGKVKMNVTEASHLAQVSASAWLNPFTGEIWGWVTSYQGSRKLSIMPGRKGLIRHAKEQAIAEGDKFWPEYTKVLALEVRQGYGLEAGDLAYECQLRSKIAIDTWNRSLEAAAAAELPPADIKEMVGKRPYTFGLGVLRAAEIAQLDKRSDNRMTHTERCQKRAYMMALKQAYVLPLASSIGDQGQTMEDFVPEGEWREVTDPPDPEDPDTDPPDPADPETDPADPAEQPPPDPPEPTQADPPEGSPAAVESSRPYAPEVVKLAISGRIITHKGARKTDKVGGMELWQYVAWQMGELFTPDDNPDAKRHTVLSYLLNKQSSKELNGAECLALIQWLDPQEWDGEGSGLYPNPLARSEARLIHDARLIELGQIKMQELET